jgi:hypothetical protein
VKLDWRKHNSLFDFLDQMGILLAVCGEGSMWFCGIVSLDTLGVLGSELVWGKVGSLFSGVFRSYGGLTKRSRGIGIRFRHFCWLIYGY